MCRADVQECFLHELLRHHIFLRRAQLRFALFISPQSDGDELNSIEKDIGETANLIAKQPETALELQRRLRGFLNRYYPDMPPPSQKFKKGVGERLAEDGIR